MKSEIIQLTSEIPRGRVTSYGAVAIQLDRKYDIKTSGWMVGKILSGMSDNEAMTFPWQRVVNKQWYISSLKLGARGLLQKTLLQKEGITIVNDTIDMKTYGRNW